MSIKLKVISILVLALSNLCYSGITTDPFAYFNVYSLGNIGSATSLYHSDFQGVAGAGGDVYFSGFSLDGHDTVSDYVLHTGGNATLGGNYVGNLEIGGNLSLGGVSVYGNAYVGGNVSNYGGGSLFGDIVASGQIGLSQSFTVTGMSSSLSSFNSIMNYDSLSNYFLSTSRAIAAMDNTAVLSNQWGGINLTALSGINVVSLSANELRNAWGFNITAPEDATIYINIYGETATLDSTDWVYTGGVSSGNVLLNYLDATALNLSGGNTVNILAPYADTNFSSGVVTGSLIVGNLFGGGQVNLGHFQNTESVAQGYPIPEPASVLLVCVGGLLVGLGRKAGFFDK
jgi:choice-of-anchor A domain-containing protein